MNKTSNYGTRVYMNGKISVIVIVGPTASGKSDLGVRIAKKFNGEIISADSRQVYKDLNIGSAKVKGKWKKGVFMCEGVPHFCIDMISPKRMYTAAEFKESAKDAILDIASRGKTPIVVGGTAFWVDTLMYDLDLPEVSPDRVLRKELERKSVDELLAMLNKLDSRRAARIEQKNPRRLIRAIEIANALGSVPPLSKRNPYRTLWIGIMPSEKILQYRIALRCRVMIKAGLIRETKKLLLKGVSKKRMREFGFEYGDALDVIEKNVAGRDLPSKLTRDTSKYAVRQMRWFKRNHDITWISRADKETDLVKAFLLNSIR